MSRTLNKNSGASQTANVYGTYKSVNFMRLKEKANKVLGLHFVDHKLKQFFQLYYTRSGGLANVKLSILCCARKIKMLLGNITDTAQVVINTRGQTQKL